MVLLEKIMSASGTFVDFFQQFMFGGNALKSLLKILIRRANPRSVAKRSAFFDLGKFFDRGSWKYLPVLVTYQTAP